MKIAIVTGAYGFLGANLTKELLSRDYRVLAVGRCGSEGHNDRFEESRQLKKIFLDMKDYDLLGERILEAYKSLKALKEEPADVPESVYFFHLAWGGGREDMAAQLENVRGSVKALLAAANLRDHILKESGSDIVRVRFVATGSQAEYGVFEGIQTEDTPLDPFSAYGKCKVKALEELSRQAKSCNIDLIWARIFSLIGKYEPEGRMFPDIVRKLLNKENVYLSSCEQYWDYLDALDAARALISLAQKGKAGEIYNVASGDYRPLKEYVEEVARVLLADTALLHYGKKAEPFVSLKPSVEKIKRDTGWKPEIPFRESIEKCTRNLQN
ncbi:MAG: NAD(P)-dependent oxidoreductase [Butyrivibrio sp.]|nr:NAD(P)-dependent oxidoreductase [Butyrivibrio sp.]